MLKRFAALICLTLGLGVSQASLADVIYTGGWFGGNKAVGGYDTVSYFTEGKPVEGKDQFTYEWSGAKWQFSSQTNLDKFKKDPRKYAPQYGGHCSWAVAAKDTLVEGNPKYWKIVDDKLYLNYDKSVQDTWLTNIPGFIAKADKNWPDLNK
ncbi:YHS domain-containing protein [Sansalvadorimonas sp. 2012CJ34-2]|uniref:YHS domain-containing protein n=1 Tax=Parendozoicomonas callyspongiae TaxID=2942213 RepID=A0ABT0PCI4_9GAMM|nr:YHS domain-containing (seleno)protein [Sansalvadorimonas sp. 2012CJ34-2]MCL6269085.1 YHS domain-containing protein [Sansalvadorimonas sp. 2012CJ34-2]